MSKLPLFDRKRLFSAKELVWVKVTIVTVGLMWVYAYFA